MKIIQIGIDPKTMPHRATCGNCGTVYEFMPSEVRIVYDQRGGDYYQFDCQVCRHSIIRSTIARYNGPG